VFTLPFNFAENSLLVKVVKYCQNLFHSCTALRPCHYCYCYRSNLHALHLLQTNDVLSKRIVCLRELYVVNYSYNSNSNEKSLHVKKELVITQLCAHVVGNGKAVLTLCKLPFSLLHRLWTHF